MSRAPFTLLPFPKRPMRRPLPEHLRDALVDLDREVGISHRYANDLAVDQKYGQAAEAKTTRDVLVRAVKQVRSALRRDGFAADVEPS